jgi:simple sugar transport system permease protein
MRVAVEARSTQPRWLTYATPVLTIGAALAVGAVALVALGVNPLAAYGTMFVGTLTSTFGVTETLVKAVPLVLTGLAVYVPLKAGLWNIGAEGQLYVGAIVGTWVGLNVDAGAVVLLPLALVGAGVAGALYGAVPGYLRARYGVNEIIVSLMLTFVGVRIASYLVRGPMRGGEGNFPVSAGLPDAAQLPTVAGTSLHAGVLVTLALVGLVALFVSRSRTGFEVTFVGANADAARGMGMNTAWIYVLVFAVGGALAGLAGSMEIMGVQERLRPEFSPGYGFTAIPIALLGRNGAGRVLLAGLFFALLFVGGSSMEVAFVVPAALVDVVQALVVLFLITAEFFKRYRLSVSFSTPTEATRGGEVEP